MRHPRIPVGAAVAAIAVAASTASAFAVAGKIPVPVAFQTVSASHTEPAPSTSPTSQRRPTVTIPAPHRPEPEQPQPATEPAKPEPAAVPSTTTPPPAPPATLAQTDGDKHESPATTAPAATSDLTPTTEVHRTDEPKPTTTTTAAATPTTSTTAAPKSGEEHPVALPVLSLTCATGVINGAPTGKCGWSTTDLAAFASWRFFRTTSTGAGQILFAGTDRSATSFVIQPLTLGQSQTYTIQALDATGRPIASSAPVTVLCCGSQTGQK